MKTLTIKEYMAITGMDQGQATGFLNGLVAMGAITSPGTRKIPGQKGKAARLYDIPDSVSVEMFNKVLPPVEAPSETPAEAAEAAVAG